MESKYVSVIALFMWMPFQVAKSISSNGSLCSREPQLVQFTSRKVRRFGDWTNLVPSTSSHCVGQGFGFRKQITYWHLCLVKSNWLEITHVKQCSVHLPSLSLSISAPRSLPLSLFPSFSLPLSLSLSLLLLSSLSLSLSLYLPFRLECMHVICNVSIP